MKKILALVLAVMMMATMAFAAAVTLAPATKTKFDISGAPADLVKDGVTIEMTAGGNAWSGDKEVNSKNFSITNIKWTKGSDLVKSLTINDDGELVFELKQNYTMVADKKYVAGTFKVTEKGKNNTRSYTIGGNNNDVKVGYKQGYVAMLSNGNVVWATGYNPAAVAGSEPVAVTPADEDFVFTVKPVKAGTVVATNIFGDEGDATATPAVPADVIAAGVSYTTLNFDAANDTTVEVKVYDGDKLYLGNDDAPDLDLVKAVTEDADLRFVNFNAEPTFSSSATLYFWAATEDDIIYKIVNGKPVASGAKWSDDDGCWTLRARTLGSYVISDMKLAAVSVDDATTNPDTGASDVVGIATAMAAIVLVSAAAVSLKK